MKRIAVVTLLAACGGGAKVAAPPATPVVEAKEPAKEAPAPDPWAGKTDLIQAPPPAKAASLNLPPVERFTLPNGLKVLVVASKDLPLVRLDLAVGAGNEDEVRGKRVLADYAAAMLTKGTQKHSADQIASTMDFIGGHLDANADLEATHITCDALAKDLATCLTLLPEVVTTPTFPQEEMKRVSDQLISQLRQIRDQPPALGHEHLANLLWGDENVRGFPNTAEGVQSISRKDLQAWHQTQFVPSNAILAVAGDVDVKQLKADLTRGFAAWKSKKKAPEKTYAEPKLSGMKVRLVDNPELTSSTIIVGHLGIAHGDRDYLPVAVMNYTLGAGQFSSRLVEVVRVKGGKTYHASSDFERFRRRGEFAAETATRNAEVVATLQLVLGEITRMHDEGPSAEEVASAKAYLAGAYALRFQGASDVVRALVTAELHGLPETFVRDYPVKVDAVTVEDAKAAAKAHLDPKNLMVVIVGKADEVGPQLEKAGIAFDRVGYTEPVSPLDRRSKKEQATAPLDPAKAAAGKKLLDAALAAKGGAAKLGAVKDLVSTGKVKLSLGGRSLEGDWARAVVPPDRMYVVVGIAELGKIKMVIGPDNVFQALNNNNVHDLPKEMADQMREGMWRDHDLILLRHLESGTQVQLADKTTVGDKAYDTVVLRRPDGSDETRVLLDPKTHLIFRLLYTEGGAPGLEEYGDYKSVDGLMLPFKQHAEGAQETFDITVAEHKVNGGVPANVWEKPKS